MSTDKLFSPETEKALLKVLLVERKTWDLVSAGLRPEHFLVNAHRLVFSAIQGLHKKQQHVDPITVDAVLAGQGVLGDAVPAGFVHGLLQGPGSIGGAQAYAGQLRRLWAHRAAQQVARRILASDPSADPSEVLSHSVRELQLIESGETAEVQLAGDLMSGVLHRLVDEADGKVPKRLLKCGLRSLDRIIQGFEPGSPAIFAARPGVGKSVLATRLADGFGEAGAPTAVFWWEDGPDAFGRRAIAGRLKFRASLLREGQAQAKNQYREAIAKVAASRTWPIYVVTASRRMSVQEMCGMIRRLAREYGIKVFIADHLGELKLNLKDFDGRHDALGDAVREYREVCKEVGAVPILMVQMNREVEREAPAGAPPKLSYLFGSGEIEQIARVVGFLSRPAQSEDDALDGRPEKLIIHVTKNTNGPKDVKVELNFFPEFMTCDDPEPVTLDRVG